MWQSPQDQGRGPHGLVLGDVLQTRASMQRKHIPFERDDRCSQSPDEVQQ